MPRTVAVDGLEAGDELLQVVGGQIDVVEDAPLVLQPGELALEQVPVDLLDDLAVHLHEPPVGVVGEAGVPGRPPERSAPSSR